MPGPPPGSPDPLPREPRRDLELARRALLTVHKALLQAERIDYEGEHGRVDDGAFLQLAIAGPRFAWLRPLLVLVVEIDEVLAADGLTGAEDAAALVAQARELVRPGEHGDTFHRRYHELLQESPAVVIAHGEAIQLLRAAAGPR